MSSSSVRRGTGRCNSNQLLTVSLSTSIHLKTRTLIAKLFRVTLVIVDKSVTLTLLSRKWRHSSWALLIGWFSCARCLSHRHNKYLDASLAARPHVNGAAILERATLHNSHIGTEENIPDSSASWASTNRRTSIKTDLGVLSFTGKTEQLFLDVFWSFLTLCWQLN